MNIVFIAIISGANGHDGFEGGRLACRHLQRIKPAPRNAEHAHLAIAPFLFGQPCDHFQRVILLLLGILIQHDAVAVARATHIHTD